MRQIIQYFKNGEIELAEIPSPRVKEGHLLIQTYASVVSVGTERMLLEFGRANYINKARQQPDKVKQVLDKIKTDGIIPTLESVKDKLDKPIPLGYANSGIVIDIGKGVSGFSIGDRVVSNGPHAEIICVPQNLCALIPDNVSNEDAAFTVIGSIGLQGIRLAGPTLGERFAVIGLGLIGLITAQLLKAHGCVVLGIDIDKQKLEIAKQLGINTVDLSKREDPVASGMVFSCGKGMDGVIITAATQSNEPVCQAAQMCRKRGRIILVGVTGLQLSRADFYEKELSFQVSCSYGPGRYDNSYEEKGNDYPFGYVRWTEQRNFEAVLEMMASGQLKFDHLISHRFPLEQAVEAYRHLSGNETCLGIVLQYPGTECDTDKDVDIYSVSLSSSDFRQVFSKDVPVVGVIGSGNFTTRTILPVLKKTGIRLKSIASSGGVSSVYGGRKFGFEEATTSTEKIFYDEDINTIFITTRHDTHASFVIRGLSAGKNVFVEKPLCLSLEDLDKIAKVYNQSSLKLMIGFNRRFSPHIMKAKKLLEGISEPKGLIITVNAGEIPADHWTQDPSVGGGRIIGEVCHFIDLLRYLVGSPIREVHAVRMGSGKGVPIVEDKVTITLTFSDGSFGTIHYFANGHKAFPKERVDVFCGGRVLSLDNFRVLRAYGWSDFKKMRLWRQDKGHILGIQTFIDSIRNGEPSPIPFQEIEEVTRISIRVSEMVRENKYSTEN